MRGSPSSTTTFENGDNGTLFYFDGDGTTNFHYPEVAADVVHEPGVGNGRVQRMNQEAADEGMDLVFLEHPDGHLGNSSWWTGADITAYTPAMQELITATATRTCSLPATPGAPSSSCSGCLSMAPTGCP